MAKDRWHPQVQGKNLEISESPQSEDAAIGIKEGSTGSGLGGPAKRIDALDTRMLY